MRALTGWICGVMLALLALPVGAADRGPRLFPADGATGVNPDTHLTLTFSAPASIFTMYFRPYFRRLLCGWIVAVLPRTMIGKKRNQAPPISTA